MKHAFVHKGFTIMEVLVIVGLIAIIALFTSGIDTGAITRSNANSEANTLIELLTRARSLALNNVNENQHGVYVDASSFILFEGDSYATAVSTQATPRNSLISHTGDTEIVFTRLAGSTTPASMTLSANGVSATIDVNAEGRIDW